MFNSFLFIASVLIWGSTWYAIDFQLGVVDPAVSLTYRYLLAAALAFGWCGWRRLSLRFDAAGHRYFLLLGLFIFSLNYLSAYHAQLYISSALNAIGFSTMIWMNIINARIFLGRRSGWTVYAGAILGMVGVLIIFIPEVEKFSLTDRILTGMFFSLLGTLIASIGNITSQIAQQRQLPVMQANAWGMLYGALINALIALAFGKNFNFDPAPAYTISLLYLAVVGSFIAFACYLTLLGRVGLEKAGYAAVMIPVVAVAFSVVLEGVTLGIHMVSGLLLALVGNVFVLAHSSTERSNAVS